MSDARAAVDRSFEELYRGHRADVFRAVLRRLGNVHDAEDITQAAFVDAYRAVLRGSQPEAPRAWLLAIAENVRRRRFRTAQRRPREEPLDADVPVAAELPHDLVRELADALASLPAEQRQVFALRELGGLSYEEIADETDSSVGAIQMLLFRARRSLRERLEPPAAARGRMGVLLPLPHWLAGLCSRADLVALTPRAAGAVGATVAAVAATVAVTDVQADAPAYRSSEPRPALLVPARASGSATPAAVLAAPAGTASAADPASATAPTRRARRPSTASSGAAPPAEPASPPAAATPAPRRTGGAATEAPAPSRVPVASPAAAVAAVAGEVENVVAGAGALADQLEAVVKQAAPAVSTVVDAAAGTAGAAGADAPPLPVPLDPPVTLPPAP